MKIVNVKNEQAMLALAGQLALAVGNEAIIYLYGSLGAGKTTFTRGFLQALGYNDKVKSPTYTLVEPYLIKEKTIYHFDFYRVKNAKELEYIGIYDYFSEPVIALIEWPENGFPLLPEPDLACHITLVEAGREVRFIAHSTQGEKILQQW